MHAIVAPLRGRETRPSPVQIFSMQVGQVIKTRPCLYSLPLLSRGIYIRVELLPRDEEDLEKRTVAPFFREILVERNPC